MNAILHRDLAIARAVFEGANHLIVATDPGGLIVAMNPAAERALGWWAAEVVGRFTPEIFHDPDEVRDRIESVQSELGRPLRRFEVFVTRAREGVPEEREWTYVRKDGSRFPVLLTVTRLHDDRGATIGYVGISTDMTDRKRLQEVELAADRAQREREIAQRASAAKSRFLAAASHDLRQPFQAVSLYLDTLQGLIREPRTFDVLTRAQEAVASCRSLLDALLDVSVLEAGAVTVKPERQPVADLLAQLVEETRPMAAERGLRLRWRAHAGAVIHSDPILLMRALRNLVFNALRYTERGGVLLCGRRHGRETLIQVWDTGIGIAPEHQEAVFETFFQIGNHARDRSQGLGLGLAVAEKTVALLGGRIELRSRPGAGSVFTVRLPVAGAIGHPAAHSA